MLQQLRSGLISAQEVHELCLRKIRATRKLNAYIKVLEDLSKSQALKAVQKYEKGIPRDLEGAPIAVKDNFCTKGVPTTCASEMLRSFVPPYDASVVRRLKESGAIVIGKTNLDEFGMGSGTTESIFGPTRNIWGSQNIPHTIEYGTVGVPSESSTIPGDDDFFISGGSSGGSAVAVASGTCFAALGSDTGGSVRNPASYCGVVGFKPSYGSVSRHGLIPLVNSMDVPGILTRTVDDCRKIFNAIRGWDPEDSTTVKRELNPSRFVRNFEGLAVGIPQEYHCPAMSDEVVDTWDQITDLLENHGARVVKVSLPHTQHSIACYSVLNACEVASNMARYDGLRYGYRARGDHLSSVDSLYAASRSQAFNHIVRGRIFAGNYFLLRENYEKYFVHALKVRRLIYEDYLKVWAQNVDLLLTPVTLSDAPLYSEFLKLDPRAQSAQQDFCTQPANMAGVPALSLPIKLSGKGLPLSLQLMAPIYDDLTLFDAGQFIETAVKFPQLSVTIT